MRGGSRSVRVPLGAGLGRPAAGAAPAAARAWAPATPRWLARLLGVPLAGKLAGANAIIVLAALAAAMIVQGSEPREARVLVVVAVALIASLAVNLALVVLALRPLWALEATAERVSRGDLEARVESSFLADRDMARIGGTLNLLLDRLTSDRARMRQLAAEVIGAGDRERARLARALHDSAAQTLAALVLELGAVAREGTDPMLAVRLEAIKGIAADVLEEVRALAQTVHPRVLDDLGLPAALRALARAASADSGVAVEVESDLGRDGVPPAAASVLYRVAEEAVRNALRYGEPSVVTIRLGVDGRLAMLEVVDDGRGFDADDVERRRAGRGIFTMRERVSLADGRFDIRSQPEPGTRVRAVVPLDQPAAAGAQEDAS